MTRKKWALLIFCILLLAGYFKFFYKTFTVKGVVKNADCIIAVDVKRITNTVIWNTITTPSQWKKISFSSSGGINWKDMFRIPDYVFIFHASGQPSNAWYTVFEIKDNEDFNKGLEQYHFEKAGQQGNMQRFASLASGIEMIRYENKVMLGNAAVSNKNYLQETATELFIKQQYTTRERLKKNTEAASHLSMQITQNDLLAGDPVVKVNFDKRKIVIDGRFDLNQSFGFTGNDFKYCDSSLCAIGFTQPPASLYKLVPDSTKMKISKLVNIDVDSLLLANNRYYDLDISGIYPRIDTAISYTYDADFNPVESKVVNNVMEPSFNFIIHGENVSQIYDRWNNSGKLEKAIDGDIFLPMPFVRSYCKKNNEKELQVVSNNYHHVNANASINCLFFMNIVPGKIPAALKTYLPAAIEKIIRNLELIQIKIQSKEKTIILDGLFEKKKNDLPVIDW